jgi:hypothetical protein
LTGARVTESVKALLEQYSGKTLEEGVGENQVQIVADVADASPSPIVAPIPPGSGSLAAAVGRFRPPRFTAHPRAEELKEPEKNKNRDGATATKKMLYLGSKRDFREV